MQKIIEFLASKRMKSLYWRTGGMALAFFLNGILSVISEYGLSSETTVFIGLIIGEVTKALNKVANK